ncbi:hypothetical protein AB0L13_45390 [Saccharopolyspora shandongensis]|uniref:hypothetical protein n=1 Tax=Saccharopolyspora shandongensis TaxID=418495 RepID=UPI0034444D5A
MTLIDAIRVKIRALARSSRDARIGLRRGRRARPGGEPDGRVLTVTAVDEVDRLARVEVDHDAAVAVPAADGEIVRAQHRDRADRRFRHSYCCP